jgi:hypothetical protein
MQNLKRILDYFRGHSKTSAPMVIPSPPPQERLKSLIDCLKNTRDDEVDCKEFDEQIDTIVELLAEGRQRGEVIPPDFQAHLIHSNDCQEEFEALLAILKAQQAGQLDQTPQE